MAQAGYTPISLYYSSTPAAAPTAGNLVFGELAINIADGKLFYEDSSNVVQVIATKDAAAGNFTTVDTTNLEVTNIKAKDGTAAASIADSTGKITVSTELAVDNLNLAGNTLSSTDSNGNIVIAPNGTGDVQLDADTVRVGDSNANATITTNGTGDLILNTNSGTNSGSITIQDGVDGNIIIAPNGNGQVQITNASLDLTSIEVTNIKAKDGTAAMTLADSTGVVTYSAPAVFTAGTVSAPSITTTGDTNTGIFFPAADTIAFTEGGVEAMRIDSSGRVGIGTSSPTEELEVSISQNSATRVHVKNTSTATAAQAGLLISNSDTANQLFSIALLGTSFTTSNLFVQNSAQLFAGNQVDGLYIHTQKASPLVFGTSATERMRIDSSGNVGIGTTSVESFGGGHKTLEVAGSTNTEGGVFKTATSGSAGSGSTGTEMLMFTDSVGGKINVVSSHPAIFYTANTERMRIDSVGNVLIGGTAARGTTAGAAHLDLFNGTAPAGTLTNGISLYSSSGDFNFMDSAGNGYKVGFRNVPAVGTKTGSYTLATGDVGKYVQVGSGGSITIPDATFAEGDVVSIFNNTTGNITITCSITTAYIAGTDTDKASVTLATRGVATILFISSTVCVITGNVS